jgi:ceramide glucosyltransferase
MSAPFTFAILCIFILSMNILSVCIMINKCRARQRTMVCPENAPPVSIIRPLRGVEEFSRETLEALFHLDYNKYEIIFCLQSGADPIIPLLREIINNNPNCDCAVLVGDEKISANPKLNNCVKGWGAAKYDYIILSDSNALAPSDYIQTMLAAFEEDTALTVSMPIGSRPLTLWAYVECAILNMFQARWQYGAEAIGIGFAQGKNMMWRREVLDRVGGIAALSREIAEDAAATKIIRYQKLRIRLVDMPFEQPLGHRSFKDVYSRHSRWARLRRATFPLHYAPEIMNGSAVAVLSGAYAAWSFGYDPGLSAFSILTLLYSAEVLLAGQCGFYLGGYTLLSLFLRDLLLPVMFIDGLLFDNFNWHGESMSVREEDNALNIG